MDLSIREQWHHSSGNILSRENMIAHFVVRLA
jgi:hypothetical protein